MITIHAKRDRRRFGRLRKRVQWRFGPPQFGNGRLFSDKDTYANRGDITSGWKKLVASDEPVRIVWHFPDGKTEITYLRPPVSAVPSEWDEDGKPIEWIELAHVHSEVTCAGRACVVHHPTNHHMRRWRLLWRGDRRPGLFERVCPHGIGHPDPDQYGYWRAAAKAWRPPLNADILDGPPVSNPFEAMGVHGCDGCCRSFGKSGT